MTVIASLGDTFSLKDILFYLDIPMPTFYYRATHPKCDRYANERVLIRALFEASNRAYGYRRITYALKCDHDVSLDRKTVTKIMAEEGLRAKGRRRRAYTSYKGTVGKIADNVLKRDFKASAPLQKLVSDITQFNIGETRVYLSPLVDLFNGEVISWKIGKSPNMNMVLDMLFDVLPKLADKKPIIHTDQGFQYQNHRWQYPLKKTGCTQSMSRKGNCIDNSPAESFFGRLKTEFSDGSDFKYPKHFMRKFDDYIHWYNEGRIKSSLSGMTPVEYRIMHDK